ncbi:MAG: DNA translocase FtsK, partial [Candidatus Ventricola sp.]
MAKKAAQSRKKRTIKGKRTAHPKRSGVEARGVAGIAVLCVGLLALACQFIPSSGGLLKGCTLITRGLGGTLCLLLPVMLCWAGVTLVFFSSGRMSARTMVCGALVFLLVETFLQVFQIGGITASLLADGVEPTYGGFLARSFRHASIDCSGGGLIGALLAWPLYRALDVWGAVIVLIFATMLVLMVFTGASLGGVGMAASEMLDDLRVEMRERREERTALRDQREEEQLAREAELAGQRQQRRAQREQQRAEQEKRRQAEQEQKHQAEQEKRRQAEQAAREEEIARAIDAGQPRQDAQAPRLEVVRPQPARADEPPIQAGPARRGGRRRQEIREDMPLYIERDDEFTRESIDVRSETRAARRRQSFTVQEAEEAFLYGMHRTPQQAQPAAPDAGIANDAGDAEADAWSAPAQDAAAHGEDGQAATMPGPQTDTQGAGETEPPADAAAGWPDADETEYRAAEVFDEPEEAAYAPEAVDDEDDIDMPADVPRARREAQQAADEDGGTPLATAILRAQRAAAQSQPQDVLAAQRDAMRDTSNLQLRGTRADGTPLMLPKKDVHESPRITQPEYNYPPIDLLNRSSATQDPNLNAKIQAGASKLLSTLESFGVQAKLTHVTHGPAITRYELQPAPGVKVSRIVNLVDDIALNMAADGVRIEAPIPGKPAVGIEIPNERIETVSLRDVLESPEMSREKSPTAVALGKGISGAPVVADMAKMPHVLIAGATGSGKSVCINTIINSIIYRASPREVRLILIDPKVVELSVYNGIPHLLVPVVTDPKKASAALSWAVVEMEHRYKRFETMGVRNIKGYNEAIGPDEEPMSKIIVIIDELADLMMVAPGEVEESICRLAQLARAAGIHLVIATQRPSVNVIT